MAYSSLEIGNAFLSLARESRVPITQMQLQKLVYLAHGYNLALNGEPLVEDPVEAWDYGTVFRKLWDALKHYGSKQITRLIRWGDDQGILRVGRKDAIANLTVRERSVVRRVWDTYGKFPAFKLSALSHDPDGPWREYYREGESRVIPNSKIESYFHTLIRESNGKRRATR